MRVLSFLPLCPGPVNASVQPRPPHPAVGTTSPGQAPCPPHGALDHISQENPISQPCCFPIKQLTPWAVRDHQPPEHLGARPSTQLWPLPFRRHHCPTWPHLAAQVPRGMPTWFLSQLPRLPVSILPCRCLCSSSLPLTHKRPECHCHWGLRGLLRTGHHPHSPQPPPRHWPLRMRGHRAAAGGGLGPRPSWQAGLGFQSR